MNNIEQFSPNPIEQTEDTPLNKLQKLAEENLNLVYGDPVHEVSAEVDKTAKAEVITGLKETIFNDHSDNNIEAKVAILEMISQDDWRDLPEVIAAYTPNTTNDYKTVMGITYTFHNTGSPGREQIEKIKSTTSKNESIQPLVDELEDHLNEIAKEFDIQTTVDLLDWASKRLEDLDQRLQRMTSSVLNALKSSPEDSISNESTAKIRLSVGNFLYEGGLGGRIQSIQNSLADPAIMPRMNTEHTDPLKKFFDENEEGSITVLQKKLNDILLLASPNHKQGLQEIIESEIEGFRTSQD